MHKRINEKMNLWANKRKAANLCCQYNLERITSIPSKHPRMLKLANCEKGSQQ